MPVALGSGLQTCKIWGEAPSCNSGTPYLIPPRGVRFRDGGPRPRGNRFLRGAGGADGRAGSAVNELSEVKPAFAIQPGPAGIRKGMDNGQ